MLTRSTSSISLATLDPDNEPCRDEFEDGEQQLRGHDQADRLKLKVHYVRDVKTSISNHSREAPTEEKDICWRI